MKKHLLSTYGYFCESAQLKDSGKTIYETSSVETTDADEFKFGPTIVTEAVESSDADEFLLQGPTYLTFTQENTDEDEFLPDILSDSNDRDFDEILLI